VLKTRQANIMKREYYTGPATLAPVKIDLNFDKALAAVLRYGATEEQAKAFAARLGLQVADFDEHNRIVTFSLPYDTSRPDVARFAGAARQLLSGSPFAEIGLALTPPLADTSILVNDEFVVRFEREMTDDEVEALTGNAVEIVEKNPFRENEYLLRVDPNAGVDALDVANRYHEDPCAVYGVPNLAIVPQFRGYVPNDTFFPEQWHLNDELNNADINAPEAWDISKGDGVVIAVIDSIDDSNHPDLSGNLWVNPGEGEVADGNDNDDNDYVDDIHGCDFGYSDDSERAHGTAVAGCIGAQMDNDLGVTGSCPNCKLMLLRCSIWTYDQKKAFDYACAEGADVICCAWGYRHGIPVPQDVNDAIHFAAKYGRPVVDPDPNRGCVIVFAMTNEPNDNSAKTPDISSLEEVIAVSGCTSEGLLSGFGFGADMDLLAPTSGGTRSIVTTDLVGNDGYNPSTAGGSSNDLNNLDYTQFFGGTSAACATAAGVAGLVLSANPNLRRFEVQDILQRTADKIDAENAGYGNNGTGHSNKYGYGRINAYKAVSAALECK
jgi:subtilisin family serine protease